ncbi:MAG: heme/hemopexin-binding protein HxuB [Rubrivivax sp.]
MRHPTLLLLSLAAAAAGAQTVPLPDAGRLLQEQRQDNRPLPTPGQAPRVVEPPARPAVDLPEGTTIAVTGFRITGARAYPMPRLEALVKPWVGRTLDLKGLNEAAGALTRLYQSEGHLLSYAYLPAQKVDGGVVEIAVLEGRIDAVQVVTAQEVRLRDEVVQAHTQPLTQTEPVLQAEVERKLLLLNDIPGVVARAAFTPGASTGTADVVVSVAEDEPLALRVEADNHGSRSSGEYRAGVQMQLRDLSGLGDSTTLRATVSNGGGLVSGSIATQLPVGGDGLRLGASLSRLNYSLSGDFGALGATGVASTLGVDASWPWLRGAGANLWLRGSLDYKRLTDEVVRAGVENQRTLRQGTLGASGDWRDSWLGGGSSAVSGTLALGQVRGGGNRDAFKKAQLQLARTQALFGPVSAYARVLAQYTGAPLDSAEKLALGGPGGVRAYAPGEASVDIGRLWSAELRYALPYPGGQLTASLFHDQASGTVVRGGSGAGNDVRLRGAGLGLQWTSGDHGVAASLAWRGDREPLAEGGDPKPRIYLQLFATP